MPPVLLPESIYDRACHLAIIKELLGEDLWFTKRRTKQGPVPRQRFADKHLIARIKDGKHPLADEVMQAFVRYWPRSRGTLSLCWNDYGVLQRASNRITTVTKFSGYGPKPRTHATAPSVWLQHAFLQRSVLPTYASENEFDCVRLDVDVGIGGETLDLYRLQRDDLVRILAPWVDGIEALRRSVGHFEAEWMLSGHRGFWLGVFFHTGGTRTEALGIREAIIRSVQGTHTEQEGKPVITVGDLTYSVHLGNLGSAPCKIPWSMHQSTNNVSVNIDPTTCELDVLQFVRTPYNEGSLSEFSAMFPACWDEPVQRMTGAEYEEFLRSLRRVSAAGDAEPISAGGPATSEGKQDRKRGSGSQVRWDDDADRRLT